MAYKRRTPLTLEQLKRRGDEAIAAAQSAITDAQQIRHESRKLHEGLHREQDDLYKPFPVIH